MIDYYTSIPAFKKEIPKFLAESNNFAIIGINDDPKSLGYQLAKNLKKDFQVFFVSPKVKKVLGQKCYATLSEIEQQIDVAVIVTPYHKTLSVIKDCLQNKIFKVWIEPGSESSQAIEFCKKNNIKAIYFHSILKERTNPSTKYHFREES